MPTIEETVTATHPPVIPLKPVRARRPAARVPTTEVDAPTPPIDAPVSDSGDMANSAVVTRSVFRGVLIGLRIAAVVALAMVIFFAWEQNWVGSTADAAIAWYSTNVAPHLEVHFVSPEVPTVQDVLVDPLNDAPLVTTG